MSINPAWLIQKKRDGGELSSAEIHSFVKGLLDGDVADYQASAFLMAVFFRGMSLEETVALTEAMLDSGDRYDLSRIPGMKVDKHSTGGVGDKVSLVLAPLAAACGLKIPMMSGRGLGHTGGTLDKLESIRGFDVNLSRERFDANLLNLGCAMIGQSDKIAPADKRLYSLRDVTGTVECIPLIVASILSKKLAEGTQALVFDVKVGNGAFMKSKEQARRLAKTLIMVAKKMGVPCRALITDMNQPLGYAAGNALEIQESVEILRNEKSADASSCDVKELSIQLCAQMLDITGKSKNLAEGRKLARARLVDGSAWKVFQEVVAAQGGSVEQIQDTSKLPKAAQTYVFKSPRRGFVTHMDTEHLGRLLVNMGGGRKKVTDQVDPGVGIVFHRKLGAKVNTGDAVATVYHNPKAESCSQGDIEAELSQAIQITGARKPVPKLILDEL